MIVRRGSASVTGVWLAVLVGGFFLAALAVCPGRTAAQEASPPPAAPEGAAEQGRALIGGAGYQENLNTLEALQRSIDLLQEQIRAEEGRLAEARPGGRRPPTSVQLEELRGRLEEVERSFEQIATGVDPESLVRKARERFDLRQELAELLSPLIDELSSVTARPREIESLRGEQTYYRRLLPTLETALANLRELKALSRDDGLQNRLARLEQEWRSRHLQAQSGLAVVQLQLEQRTEERPSYWEAAQGLLRGFFKSRGRNLLLAFLAFAAVYAFLRFLHRKLRRAGLLSQAPGRSFYWRTADLFLQVLIVVGAVLALQVTLYLAGDWVLLGLSILFLLGLAWAAKQALPRFGEEAKLILNLGPVREGERILYQGVPWEVSSLDFYARLANPELSAGRLTIPVRRLLDLESRPAHAEEPWFPCRVGEWVILADGTRGRVVSQTAERVELELLGGSRKTYPTPAFLGLNPDNVSRGFRLHVGLGLDYQHQAQITTVIPRKLEEALTRGLGGEGFGDQLLGLRVEFREASRSSLDLEVLAEFAGRAAEHHESLSRSIQRIAVETCTREGWVIPFTQLTLHSVSPPA